MDTDMTEYARLSLLVQRLLDAETLPEAEGEALLKASQTAYQTLTQGDAEDARRQVTQIARQMQALLERKALGRIDGHAVLQTANRILNPEMDAAH